MIEEILKRLELIKMAMVLKDDLVLQLQSSKLKEFGIEEVSYIAVLLENHSLEEAEKFIDSYIEKIESKKSIEWYAVSFIDILGQDFELLGLNTEDLSNQAIRNIIACTYENVKKLRTNIKDAFGGLEIMMDKDAYLDSNKIKINAFSDLIINYVSLRNDIKTTPTVGIYRLFLANSSAFLVMLSNEISLRGAIDIGRGLEHRLNGCDELYGTALSNPYHLESNVAHYPRMVIGKKLYDYLYGVSIVVNGEQEEDNIRFAKECLSFIKRDSDGEYILDYLYVCLHHLDDFDKLFLMAKKFINTSLVKFNNEHKQKEYLKYISLKKYFDSKEIL